MQTLKHTKQKQQPPKKNKSKQKTLEKNKQTTSTAHPAGTRDIFIRGRVVGWRMYCIFFCAFLEGVLLFLLFVVFA